MTTLTDLDTVRIPAVPARRTLDAARLWTGGLATALVAALIGLVGVLVARVVQENLPHVAVASGYATQAQTLALCAAAAAAALAATGLAHLLLLSTPRPLAYLGWIVGLATAAAVVLPLASGVVLAAALAEGVVNLVIGLAIGSLVTGAALASLR